MTRLIRNGGYAPDSYAPVADDAPLPEGAVLVSLARFQKEREALLSRNAPHRACGCNRTKIPNCWATM